MQITFILISNYNLITIQLLLNYYPITALLPNYNITTIFMISYNRIWDFAFHTKQPNANTSVQYKKNYINFIMSIYLFEK